MERASATRSKHPGQSKAGPGLIELARSPLAGQPLLELQQLIGNRGVSQLGAGVLARSSHPVRAAVHPRLAQVLRQPLKDKPAPAPAPEPALDFDELESEYNGAQEQERSLYDFRAIGAREVLGDLREVDAPSIADIILKACVMGALGYASGGISMAITNRVIAIGSRPVLENAIQSGIDDAMKDAVPALVAKAMAAAGSSRSSFFAGIEAGLIRLREAAVLKLNDQQLQAKKQARANPGTLEAAIRDVKAHRKTVTDLQTTAQRIQYEKSVGQWMVALAQGELGTAENVPGTDMTEHKGHGGDPTRFFHRGSVSGVLEISFGLKSASRPLGINFGRVSGLNDATKEKLKDTKLKDLGFPIFSQGWLISGFWDGLEKGDNEVTMSMNAEKSVFVNYGPDAEEAMLGSSFAKGKSTVLDVARDILENDFGDRTLGSVKGIF